MTGNRTWPCPVCAEVITVGEGACPYCLASGAWIELIGALDFSTRRFELWKLQGAITVTQYRQILDATRGRRQAMVQAAQAGQPLPEDTGLPPCDRCWRCRTPFAPGALRCGVCGNTLHTPEVRLLRYQSFLCSEIQRHADSGILSTAQWQDFLTETPERQIELLCRLEQGWKPGGKS
jgi:hypothetical protein